MPNTLLAFRTKVDFSEISTHLSNLLSTSIKLEKFSVTKFCKSKHTENMNGILTIIKMLGLAQVYLSCTKPSQRRCIFSGRNLLRYLLSLSLNLRVLSYIFYMVRKKLWTMTIFLLQQRSRSCNLCLSVNLVKVFYNTQFSSLLLRTSIFQWSSSNLPVFMRAFIEHILRALNTLSCSLLANQSDV